MEKISVPSNKGVGWVETMYIPWKHKISGFLLFAGVAKRDQSHEICFTHLKLTMQYQKVIHLNTKLYGRISAFTGISVIYTWNYLQTLQESLFYKLFSKKTIRLLDKFFSHKLQLQS